MLHDLMQLQIHYGKVLIGQIDLAQCAYALKCVQIYICMYWLNMYVRLCQTPISLVLLHVSMVAALRWSYTVHDHLKVCLHSFE